MKLFKSIKWRLQLWYGLILVVVLAGLGVTAYQLERGKIFRHADNELQRRQNVLVQTARRTLRQQFQPQRPPFRGNFGLPPRPLGEGPPDDGPLLSAENFRLPPRDEFLFDAASSNGSYYVIGSLDGKEIARSTNAPIEELNPYLSRVGGKINQFAPYPPLPGSDQPKDDGRNIKYDEFPPGGIPDGQPGPPHLRGNYREVDMILSPNSRGQGLWILVGRDMSVELGELRRTALKLTGMGLVILFFGLAGGWWLVSRALKPISSISAAATKIAAGDLSQRINTAETESELGQLAAVLNSTFARLEAAFAQQRQFASDAAHELRTPISIILTQTQTALNRERDAAGYKQTVEACQRAAQRMRRLIESLLELARFDAGQEVLKRLPVNLAGVATDCMELMQPLADERQVKLSSELADTEITGDPERISQVVLNLLTNAIQYNQPGGGVHLRLAREENLAVLVISDTGQGISTEDLHRVFERFYRADQSRTGASNTGLGLSISKAIIEAHGGTIEVTSKANAGTTFTVRLPLT